MDMIKVLNLSAIFLPLFFAFYLVIAKVKKFLVEKRILNNLFLIISGFTFLIFLSDKFIFKEATELFDFDILNFNGNILNLSTEINESNIYFLLISSILFLIFSIFLKLYFQKNKQLVFIKQRYTCLITLLVFNTFIYLSAANLITSAIIWILTGLIIFVFTYFDILKNLTNANIIRFQRITLLGDVSLLVCVLGLLKYEILSQGYLSVTGLNYSEFDVLVSYIYGISSSLGFKVIVIAMFLAIITKLILFPFSCYYTFLSNSSNIIYLPVLFVNNIFGCFMLSKFIPFVEISLNLQLYLIIFSVISLILMPVFLLFEKSIKIISGDIVVVLNAILLLCMICTNAKISLLLYAGIGIAICIVLMFCFLNDIEYFPRRILNKQKGFYLENIHIALFEMLPSAIATVVELIVDKFIVNIYDKTLKLIKLIVNIFVYKTSKISKYKLLKYILMLFVLYALVLIIIALFGESLC